MNKIKIYCTKKYKYILFKRKCDTINLVFKTKLELSDQCLNLIKYHYINKNDNKNIFKLNIKISLYNFKYKLFRKYFYY